MVDETVIQKLRVSLEYGRKLVPSGHLLLYDLLVESDEGVVIFTHSFILVGPDNNYKREVARRLELSFSDFAYPGDSSITASVLNWLSDRIQTFIVQGQYLTEQNGCWQPSWHTRNDYMPQGASYRPVFV